jgi:hypothetical protein
VLNVLGGQTLVGWEAELLQHPRAGRDVLQQNPKAQHAGGFLRAAAVSPDRPNSCPARVPP